MTRVNVYRYDRGYAEPGQFEGWFTPEECVALVEANVQSDAEFDRARRKGAVVRGVVETLFRTPEGRWVLRSARRAPFGDQLPDPHEFLTDEQALEWLTRQGYESRIAEFFGELPSESGGPGRPEIGGRVQVRLGNLLAEVDAYAERRDITRAEAVRVLVAAGLDRTT